MTAAISGGMLGDDTGDGDDDGRGLGTGLDGETGTESYAISLQDLTLVILSERVEIVCSISQFAIHELPRRPFKGQSGGEVRSVTPFFNQSNIITQHQDRMTATYCVSPSACVGDVHEVCVAVQGIGKRVARIDEVCTWTEVDRSRGSCKCKRDIGEQSIQFFKWIKAGRESLVIWEALYEFSQIY